LANTQKVNSSEQRIMYIDSHLPLHLGDNVEFVSMDQSEQYTRLVVLVFSNQMFSHFIFMR